MPDPIPIPITRAYAEQLLQQTSHDLGLPIGITPAERARLAHDLEDLMTSSDPITITGEFGTTVTITPRHSDSARLVVRIAGQTILDDLTPHQLDNLRDALCQLRGPAQASDNGGIRGGGQ